MNDRQARALASGSDALAGARGLKNPPDTVRAAIADLETIVKLATAASIQQLSAELGVGSPRKAIEQAKLALRKKHMVPISSNGKTLLKGYPGIVASLRMPKLKDSAEDHVKAAARFHEVVAPHKAVFIKSKKFNKNFLKELDAAAAALARLAAEPTLGRQRHTQTTSDVRSMVKAVRQAVADLDAQIQAAYFGDRVTLALWRGQKKVKRKVGRPTKRQAEARSRRRLDEPRSDQPPPA
jgi:hypothetical protein